jgi:hypothetical protein
MKNPVVAQKFGQFFQGKSYTLNLGKNVVGFCFGRYFHKLIWSPCMQRKMQATLKETNKLAKPRGHFFKKGLGYRFWAFTFHALWRRGLVSLILPATEEMEARFLEIESRQSVGW